MALPKWRKLLVTEIDVFQRVLGVDTVPSFGTAEAERLLSQGLNAAKSFSDSGAAQQFAPIAGANSGSIGSAIPGTTGSAAIRDAQKRLTLPSVQTTRRYGGPLISPKLFRELGRKAGVKTKKDQQEEALALEKKQAEALSISA
jgi:hypothetical protein